MINQSDSILKTINHKEVIDKAYTVATGDAYRDFIDIAIETQQKR